jgi:hypothetical protein
MEPFYRTRLPSWLIGVLMNLMMGLLFANLAMTKLEHFNEKRPIAVRGLSTALWTLFVLFLTGNIYGQSFAAWAAVSIAGREVTVGLLGFYFGLLLVMLPIFTTGDWEIRSHQPRVTSDEWGPASLVTRHSSLVTFVRGMLPHAMLRAELPSGTPLMALWVLITGAIVIGGFLVMGKPAQFPIEILPLFLTIGAVTAAFSALGNFLSVAFQDRKATVVLTYLTIAAACLLPFFGYMTWEASTRSSTPHLSWQFLYLTPFVAFVQMAEARSSFWTGNPPMLLGQTPIWLVTGAIYAALAALLFALTLNRIARQGTGNRG